MAFILAPRGEPVVPAQPPVDDLFAVHRDQLVGAEPVQGGVQGPGAQLDLAAGDVPDVGDDPVPVLGAVGQRGEDQEGRFLHGPRGHADFIYRLASYCKSGSRRNGTAGRGYLRPSPGKPFTFRVFSPCCWDTGSETIGIGTTTLGAARRVALDRSR
jgi:hypothetical protein